MTPQEWNAHYRAIGYHCWYEMCRRTSDPSRDAYEFYKHRSVWEPWTCPVHGFERFIAYIGPRPSLQHSIDRIDNDGDYVPGNVRWATPEQQLNNRSNCQYIEHNGERRTHTQWSRHLGGNINLVGKRVFELGWDPIRAVTTPVRKMRNNVRDRSPNVGRVSPQEVRHSVADCT